MQTAGGYRANFCGPTCDVIKAVIEGLVKHSPSADGLGLLRAVRGHCGHGRSHPGSVVQGIHATIPAAARRTTRAVCFRIPAACWQGLCSNPVYVAKAKTE